MEEDVNQQKTVQELDSVTIRFAGDSGDGAQTIGAQFTNVSALMGNDLSTLPDFPAEIRAPAGSLAGVSGFQVHFSSEEIFTPGDKLDTLVVMNPAALKVNIDSLKRNGILIANTDNFKPRNLAMAGYEANPLEDGTLDGYQVFNVDMTRLTRDAVKDLGMSNKDADRSKNMFSLGMAFWLYERSMESTINFIKSKFKDKPQVVEANIRLLNAGHNYCENTEIFGASFRVPPAKLRPGKYRNVTGNTALVLGMVAAGQESGLDVFLSSYPITPASDVLEQLSRFKNFGVRTVQAEDEIAAMCMTIGASYGGSLSFTATSGPGFNLKQEALGLATCVELPLVICNIQRAGPSTGMPTKIEQADLLQALYGRHGESPLPVLAASRPSDCFETVYECARIAIKYMTPVICLSDLYLAFGAEPWLIPSSKDLPPISVNFEVNGDGGEFLPYKRDSETLARPWAIPGTKGVEHRIGGLEKQEVTGNVSYDPENHHRMTELRAEKVAGIAAEIPPTRIDGPETGEVLVLGWGSTYGAIRTATQKLRDKGLSVSQVHLRHLNPLPPDLGAILCNFEKVLIPEINMGQLIKVIRDKFLIPAIGFNKVRGNPLDSLELEETIEDLLRGET